MAVSDPAPLPRSRWRVGAAALAVLLSAADTYVVVLALPDMLAAVGVGLDELHRGAPVVTGFLLGYVVVLPLAGRVSDRVGRERVLVACLAAFAVGCLVTASAEGLAWIVAGRVVQGLGAGGLVPPTLALVADTWPPRRRAVPLGLVSAAQEVGSVVGPLVGAAILALAGWRVIFWANLVGAVVLVGVFWLARPAGARLRLPARALLALGALLLAVAALAVVLRPPDWLASSVALGALLLPLTGGLGPLSAATSPLGLATLVLAAMAVGVALSGGGASRLRTASRGVDLVGAGLLAVVLGGVVLTFAGAEVTRSPVADQWPWLLGSSAVAAVALVLRQRRASDPLLPAAAVRPRGAWGGLAVNALLGAALVAVVVNVPIFARVTRYPDSQLAAALVLLQLLAALPIGAVCGGWLSRRLPPRAVAATGLALATAGLLAMSRWEVDALAGWSSGAALVIAGLGFGLAIAPVTVVVLHVTPAAQHGLASALVILARMVGMLVGLSALTAIGLRVFTARQAAIGSPVELCPSSPTDCPAYAEATLASLVAEQQAIFLGAAACAASATVLAAVLLVRRGATDTDSGPPPPVPEPATSVAP